MRSTTCARVSLRAMGPSWAAATVMMRGMGVIPAQAGIQ
jgi:hypothetical protein